MPRWGLLDPTNGVITYSIPNYSDMMKNKDRNTALEGRNYCFPCMFAGGFWTD